jgi:hypothetical protein
MTRNEAIEFLQNEIKGDPAYRKTWSDFVEIIVTEELEFVDPKMSLDRIKTLRKAISGKVLQLFDAPWWQMVEAPIKRSRKKRPHGG